MENSQGLGGLIGQIAIYLSIWIAVVVVLLIVIVLLLAKYFRYKKTNATDNNDRRNITLRICLYIVLGLLLFVLSPLILSAFL